MSGFTFSNQDNGKFAVAKDGEVIEDGFQTHSRAWKAADRKNDESVSPVEGRTDYHNRKSIEEAHE